VSATVTITREPGAFSDTWQVRFRYQRAWVELLKDTVPGYDREWDPDRRVWVIADASVQELAEALAAVGASVQWVNEDPYRTRHRSHRTGGDAGPPPPPPPRGGTDTCPWARVLLDAVGETRREPVFRALSKVLHPDTATGDAALMRELLEARETRRKAS